METHWLTCHPETPGKAIKAISAKISRLVAGHIGLWFDLHGDTARLAWPELSTTARTDGLWQSTCLEFFVAEPHGTGYCEFNFSPSGAWAAYRFEAYRQGQSPLPLAQQPEVYEAIRSAEQCSLSARILTEAAPETRLGLSAVIEELDGTKSYWALAHPPGQPDFHHPACFVATLPAPQGS